MPFDGESCTKVNRRSGMTLTELVAAMAIALLVIAIIGASFHTVTTVVARRQADRSAHAREGLLLLARELAALTTAGENDKPSVHLSRTTGVALPSSRLRFNTLLPPEGERNPRWAVPHSLLYELDTTKDPPDLIRIAHPLSLLETDAIRVTNILIRGVVSFDASLFDGVVWRETWEDSAGDAPFAAHIAVDIPVGNARETYEIHVKIPVSSKVYPSERLTDN